MNRERWQKVEEIYHAVLVREESERAAFLQVVCADDEGGMRGRTKHYAAKWNRW